MTEQDQAMEDIFAASQEQEIMDKYNEENVVQEPKIIKIPNSHLCIADILVLAEVIPHVTDSWDLLRGSDVVINGYRFTDPSHHVDPPEDELLFLTINDEVIAQLVAEDELYEKKIIWGGVAGPWYRGPYSLEMIRSHHSHMALFEQIPHDKHRCTNPDLVPTKEELEISQRALENLPITWKTINKLLDECAGNGGAARREVLNSCFEDLKTLRDRIMNIGKE